MWPIHREYVCCEMVCAPAIQSSDCWFKSGWHCTDLHTDADGNGWLGLLDGAIVPNVARSIGANPPVGVRVGQEYRKV
jgi:hypothetical protein